MLWFPGTVTRFINALQPVVTLSRPFLCVMTRVFVDSTIHYIIHICDNQLDVISPNSPTCERHMSLISLQNGTPTTFIMPLGWHILFLLQLRENKHSNI